LVQSGRLLVLGDLNTMGLQFPKKRAADERVSEAEEVEALGKFGSPVAVGMITKSHDETFNNGRLVSNLDHVLSSSNVRFKSLGTRPDGVTFQVRVVGWNQLTGTARKNYIDNLSDHSALYVEVV